MLTPTWTDERLELLKSGFEAGRSCRQIADDLGITRNAVIGKLSRLGLTSGGRVTVARPRAAKTTRPTRIGQRQTLATLLARPPAEEAPLSTEHHCSLLELNEDKCRWPISHLTTSELWYCGNKPERGFSYCAGHARIAYHASRARVARPSM